MNYQRRVIIAFSLLMGLLTIGTIGYYILEKNNPNAEWDLFQAIWMTVTTLTTVGYGDGGMGITGRAFTIFLLIGGFGLFFYSVTIATSFLVEGQLLIFFKQRKMIRTVEKISNHYIICGLGDTGVHVLDEMLETEANFVGIEIEEERLEHLTETREFLHLHGDATDDDVLLRAGIVRAQGLVACLSRDQDNLFVVISAKKLNPNLRVVSKAVEHNSPGKLVTAGADEVVLPDHIGGIRLASGILQPHLIDFFTKIRGGQQSTRFSEAIIQPGSPLDGISLQEAHIQEQTGLVVIAIRNKDGTFSYNPHDDKRIAAGDAIFIIADRLQLQTLHKLTGDPF